MHEFSLTPMEIANARLWKSEIAAFQTHPFSENGVLFTGSSSMRLWSTLEADFPGLPIVNRGFGGSQLSDSAYHFGTVVVPVAPRAVVFYAGDNDLALEKTPTRVAENFQALAELMRVYCSQAPLFFISIKPSPSRWNLIEKIREANSQIEEICRENSQLHFANIESCLLDESGLPRTDFYIEDELHLSAKGYAAWTRVLRPLLERFTDDKIAASLDN